MENQKQEQISWLKVKMVLHGTPQEVSRTIVIPVDFCLSELTFVLEALFQFDRTLPGTFVGNDFQVMLGDEVDVDYMGYVALYELFDVQTPQKLFYTYSGENTWQVELFLEKSSEDYNRLECLDATGNGILLPHMTKELYMQLYTFSRDQTPAAQNIRANVTGEDAYLFNTNYVDADITEINQILGDVWLDLDRDLDIPVPENVFAGEESVADPSGNIEALLAGDEQSGYANLDEEGPDVAVANEFMVYLYTEIAGFSEDQAAYEVLCYTTVESIYSELLAHGYDFETISKMVNRELAFDEKAYELVEEQLDLLAILPERAEIFTAEEEAYLNEITTILQDVLENEPGIVADTVDFDAMIEKIQDRVHDLRKQAKPLS